MIAKASTKYLKISPRKANEVLKLFRGKMVNYALQSLPHINKKAGYHLLKLLKSVVANARNSGLDPVNMDNVYISKLVANSGPVIKRFRSAPFGRAVQVLKRTSHIEVELDLAKKG